ncbi:MAG: hypothetical protein ACOC0P_00225 [Planctomycetota bacterium]
MQNYFSQLALRFRAEKRKYTMAFSLLALGLLLWGRLVIVERIPRTGYADPDEAAIAAGDVDSSSGIMVPHDPWKTVTIRVPEDMERNPFAASTEDLAPSAESESVTPDPRKSEPEASEKTDGGGSERIRQMEKIRREAESLRLEFVMLSPQNSVALISGVRVGTGDKVQGFTVRSIAERSVTLSKNNIVITLNMETPGQP